LVTMATAAILRIFLTPPKIKLPHTTVDIPTKFYEVWWKESKIIFNPPFFVSMASAEKFVQPIPIFLAYLVPLHETLILLSFCVFIEMVICLNTIILKSFLIIVFTSILNLFYRTIIHLKYVRHIFFINIILGPITSDVMNTVTLSTCQYAPNTRN
jgi:hypothetical protein